MGFINPLVPLLSKVLGLWLRLLVLEHLLQYRVLF